MPPLSDPPGAGTDEASRRGSERRDRPTGRAEGPEALLPAWPFTLFGLLLGIKLFLIWGRIDFAVESGYSALRMIGFVVFEDACILGVLVLLLFAGLRFPRLARITGAGAITLLSLYALDAFLFEGLFGRASLLNLVRYASEVGLVHTFLTPKLLIPGALVILPTWWLRRRASPVPASRPVLVAACALVLVPSVVSRVAPQDPYLDLAFANVLRINAQHLLRRGVSDETFERAKSLYPRLWADLLSDAGPRAGSGSGPGRMGPPGRAGEGAGRSLPDLILVVSESLSRIDSARSGGLHDRLPRIDAVAADGVTFTELVANGADSTDALASLLAGEEPLTTPLLSSSMQALYPVDRSAGVAPLQPSLVARARQLGYTTVFATNSPLAFRGNGAWLRRLGFHRVEDGRAPHYRGETRYSFNSPPDETLFSRAVELIDATERRPILLVLLTISLHTPYRTPEPVGEDGRLQTAIRYVDRETSAFYRTLRRRGYFDSGYLLIVGDHRRMTPLDPGERRSLGLDSLGRIFGCLVGPGVPAGSFVTTPLNQSDLFGIATDLLRGTLSFDEGFRRHNKGMRHGLGTLFTTHLVSPGRGLVLVRRQGRAPYMLQVSARSRPVAEAREEPDRRIAAYVALRTRLLQERQEAIRR